MGRRSQEAGGRKRGIGVLEPEIRNLEPGTQNLPLWFRPPIFFFLIPDS